ncbi:T7SS effector LXG polymorphic toxin [Listeria riparia]|uniref:LXG domain-containing protein n=1 Tax=Listeria riparia FSL S10-1204 TaxID=1265816 RepID=W7D2N8_9LIST|nr:T7SS effector LXG polymorphic toxin [Listeria riparia]EUJ43457.1 hypothetical protein PRIP_13054 [Listeria riparia FSL S10-1204]
MSVNMFLDSADEQMQSIQSMCQMYISEMEQVKATITYFTAETALKGRAYDAAKEYFEATYVPLANGIILIAEAVQKAAKKLVEEYRTEVDENSLQEDALRNQLRQLGDLMEESTMCFAPSATSLSGAEFSTNPFLPFYENQKQEIQGKLDKLLSYDIASATLFAEVESIIVSVETGLRKVNSGRNFDVATGIYATPAEDDSDWSQTIQNNYQEYLKVTKTGLLAGGYASTLNVLRAETVASSKKN